MKNDKKLFWIYALTAFTFFSQGMEDLPGQSLFFWFKETLNLSPSTIMYLGSIITIPWIIKPIWGWFSDSYLSKKLIVALTVIGSSLIAFFFGVTHSLPLPLIITLLTVGAFFTAMRSTAVGGVACIEGKCYNNIEKLQSIRWISITLAGIVTGLAGGYVAEHYSYQIGYLLLIPFYAFLFFSLKNFVESKSSLPEPSCSNCYHYYTQCDGDEYNVCQTYKVKKESFLENLKSYKAVFTDKKFLLLCVFLFLYNYAPAFGTPLSFIQRDKFGWSKEFMGFLGALGAAMSIIGAYLFYKYANKFNVRKLLIISVWVGAITSLCYLWYTPFSAILFDVVFSIVGMFVELVIMTLMTQQSLTGKEATSFAVMCSITNFAGLTSSISGAWLLPKIGLPWLIILAAGTSFICLPLISRLEWKNGQNKSI